MKIDIAGGKGGTGKTTVSADLARVPGSDVRLLDFNGYACITGPCGDTMEFWLRVRNDNVEKAAFYTDGCESSLACGSMATCLVEGKPVADAIRLCQKDILEALGGLPEETEHCALLVANTLKAACEDYLSHRKPKARKETHHDRAT